MRVHLRDGAQDMRIKDSRLWLRILIAIAFLVGTVAVIFELLIWQSNKLSPEFRTAARPAFEAIQQCERYVDQSAFAYGTRLEMQRITSAHHIFHIVHAVTAAHVSGKHEFETAIQTRGGFEYLCRITDVVGLVEPASGI